MGARIVLSVSISVGICLAGFAAPVTNLNTGETFNSIQAAIDDPDTLDGHIIEVNSAEYDCTNEPGHIPFGDGGEALINIWKAVTVRSTHGATNTVLDGTGHNVVVTINAEDVVLSGFTITGAQYSMGTLGWAAGIFIGEQTGVTVEHNIIEYNGGYGVYLSEASNNSILNNEITNNVQCGIKLWRSDSCEVSGNVISGTFQPTGNGWGGFGIEVAESNYNCIVENTIVNNTEFGIQLAGSSNTIQNNFLSGNGDYGIQANATWDEEHQEIISSNPGNRIIGNRIFDTVPANWEGGYGYGINLGAGITETYIGNNIIANNRKGINLWQVSSNTIESNTVYNNEWYGICLNVNCCDNIVLDNVVHDNGYCGIVVAANADRNTILGNEVYNTYSSGEGWVRGVGIYSAGGACGELNDNNTFSNNYVHDNAFGIMVTEASSCDITGNTVEDNNTADFGIGVVLACSDTEWWYLTAHISNGGGIYVNGPDNTVVDNTVTGNGFGIMVHGGGGVYASTGNVVSNNTVSNNTTGSISISLSKYEWVDDHWENTVFEPLFNVGAFGLFLFNCSTTKTSNNTFIGNGEFGVGLRGFSAPKHGWEGWSRDNTVSDSNIQQHEEGVWIGPQAQDNLVHYTTIQNNISPGTGVKVEEAQGNVLYCNQIVDNGPHGVENTDDAALVAYYNWWGSPNGPGADGANDVVGNVLYDPWLASEGCESAAIFRIERITGNVLTDGSLFGSEFVSGSADVAEWVLVSEPVEPGDVLEIDPTRPGYYRKARGPCSHRVAGVVSSRPGFVLGYDADAEGKALLALLGTVPVKVTDEGGPIRPGDLLVVSSTPGYAMRWDPDSGLCGFVGKALEPWEEGEGVILVLLMR